MSSSRDGNSRPLWATCSADDGGKHNREGGAEKHHARRHHAQQHRVAATVWHEQLVYCVCGPARPPQQGRCPRAIGWLIGVRCVPSGRAEMPIEAAHGATAAACATLPTASSYPRTLPRPCRAPGATLRRRKWLLQRQRDHIADIRPVIKIAEQYLCPAITRGLALHKSSVASKHFIDPPHLLDLRTGARARPAEESAARMVRSCTSPHLLALLVRQTVATR